MVLQCSINTPTVGSISVTLLDLPSAGTNKIFYDKCVLWFLVHCRESTWLKILTKITLPDSEPVPSFTWFIISLTCIDPGSLLISLRWEFINNAFQGWKRGETSNLRFTLVNLTAVKSLSVGANNYFSSRSFSIAKIAFGFQ